MKTDRVIGAFGFGVLMSGLLAGCGIQRVPSSAGHPSYAPKAAESVGIPPHAYKITMTNAQDGWVAAPAVTIPGAEAKNDAMWRTTTAGRHWAKMLIAPNVLEMDALSGSTAWVAVQQHSCSHTVILDYTNNGGHTWTRHPVTAPFPVSGVTISLLNSATGSVLLSGVPPEKRFAEALWPIAHRDVASHPIYTYSQPPQYSPNGRLSWLTWRSSTQAWGAFSGENSSTLEVSNNGGASWQSVMLPMPSWVPASAINPPDSKLQAVLNFFAAPTFPSAHTGFLLATLSVPYVRDAVLDYHQYQLLYRTTNDRTWQMIYQYPGAGLVTMDWHNASEGWILTAVHHHVTLLQTINGGETWSVITKSLRDRSNLTQVYLHFINAADGWYINAPTMQYTTNSGKTWHLVP